MSRVLLSRVDALDLLWQIREGCHRRGDDVGEMEADYWLRCLQELRSDDGTGHDGARPSDILHHWAESILPSHGRRRRVRLGLRGRYAARFYATIAEILHAAARHEAEREAIHERP